MNPNLLGGSANQHGSFSGGGGGHLRTQSSSSTGGGGLSASSPLSSTQRSDNLMTPRTMLMSSPRGPTKQTVQVSKQMIGSGAQGRVYLGIHTSTFQLVAVKKVELSAFGGGTGGGTSQIGSGSSVMSAAAATPITPRGEAAKKESKRRMEELAAEIRLMKELQHSSIVRFLSAERMGTTLHLIMEYMGGGSLDKVLGKFGHLQLPVARHYARSVLSAIGYLHSRKIIHRDIKVENILLNSDGDAKLSDFGTSRKFELNDTNHTLTGTPWYMAPEIVRQGEKGVEAYGTAADIWSFGATVAHLVTGNPPWASNNNPTSVMFQLAHHPENAAASVLKDISALGENGQGIKDATEVVLACLRVDPKERPTAEQLMDFAFFRSSS